MALKSNRPGAFLTRLHLLIRLLGVTGLLMALAGVVLAHTEKKLESWQDAWQRLLDGVATLETNLETAVPALLLLIGAGLAALALLVEVVQVLRYTAARRSASGANAVAQVGLAAALLVGVNLYSFEHYARIDYTRPDEDGERRFTLPEKVHDQLQRLQGETTIVILQQRRKAGGPVEQEDYASAAEAVVVEKVRDLADQLRAAGAEKLRVVLLDARRKDFRARLEEVTKNKPRLAEAIRSAPG